MQKLIDECLKLSEQVNGYYWFRVERGFKGWIAEGDQKLTITANGKTKEEAIKKLKERLIQCLNTHSKRDISVE